MKPAILIHGPTASGKSALSIALAKRLDGEIVNADSMQVYREMRVISARPAVSEMDGIPHHLFGHVPASERYSTGKWLDDVKPMIAKVQRRGKVPIIIGGTGLYHLTLVEGMSTIPPVPEDIRAEVNDLYKAGPGAGGPPAPCARFGGLAGNRKIDRKLSRPTQPSDPRTWRMAWRRTHADSGKALFSDR